MNTCDNNNQAKKLDSSNNNEVTKHSCVDIDLLIKNLVVSKNPIKYLEVLVKHILHTQKLLEEDPTRQDVLPVGGSEVFLANELIDAGILNKELPLYLIRVRYSHKYNKIHLVILSTQHSSKLELAAYKIEACLMQLLYASKYFGGLKSITYAETLYQFKEFYLQTTAACSTSLPSELFVEDTGEYSARYNISTFFSHLPVIYTVWPTFRCNLKKGIVTLEIEVPTKEVFSSTGYNLATNSVYVADAQNKEQQASLFALNMAMVGIAAAFRSNKNIRRVSISIIQNNANRHKCLLNACCTKFEYNEFFEGYVCEPYLFFSNIHAHFSLINDCLVPINSTFTLDNEDVCPHYRYNKVELNDSKLDINSQIVLNINKVSDLGIRTDAYMEDLADKMSREMSHNTTDNVKAILKYTDGIEDIKIKRAAMRTINKLIAGTIPYESPIEVKAEFLIGDTLTQACVAADELLQDRMPHMAIAQLEDAISLYYKIYSEVPYNLKGYKAFRNYTERCIYNTVINTTKEPLHLCDESLYTAQILLSIAYGMQTNYEKSITYARRAMHLNPLDDRACLQLAVGLEKLDLETEAIDQLKKYLTISYDPSTIAICYYRLARLYAKSNMPKHAIACYKASLLWPSAIMAPASIELNALCNTEHLVRLLSISTQQLLTDTNIPIAPTEQVQQALQRISKALVDLEYFDVAKDLCENLIKIQTDDTLFGIYKSIEDEPDF